MIISKCPLRVSLVGGSTDLESYLDEYETGAIIGFPINLYTYITINKSYDENYIIHYSKTEKVKNIDDIENDVAREVLKYFNEYYGPMTERVEPITIVFNTDIPSTGSGLASSTSYMLSMIKAMSLYLNIEMSQFEICKLAIKIEKQYNTYTGYQDSYGCGLPGLKRIDFYKGGNIKITPLHETAFRYGSMFLIDTGVRRESNEILKSINIKESVKLYDSVDKLEHGIENMHFVGKCVRDAWEIKKKTSDKVFTSEIKRLDGELYDLKDITGHKLLGAGGGGYYLALSSVNIKLKGLFDSHVKKLKVKIEDVGVTGWKI